MAIVFESLWGFTKEDASKFVADKTDRLKAPGPTSELRPTGKRIW
jgi:hypothetical protein